MTLLDPQWLELVEEDPLETDLEICDPHHHHWDHADSRYMREELAHDLRGHRVAKTVFVECGSHYFSTGPESLRPVGETEFVQSIADQRLDDQDQGGLDAGIVGHANLLLGDAVAEVLEAHLNASPDRFRGIRHSAAWHESAEIRPSHSEPPAHMLMQAPFRAGFAQLSRYGLTFDAWLFHTQLDELYDLACHDASTVIVLNHMGGPLGIGPFAGRRAEVFSEWKQRMARLAECENLVVKLGGLQMAISGFDWHRQAQPPSSLQLLEKLEPYYLYCIDQFGVDRCMFESNFPVDKVSCSYTVLWNFFKRMTRGCSDSERKALFSKTAERVYRI
ncbi:MAG: amidohydrolase family protein [Myxococcota bacterium]|nr:amidohydrolase family protein [Myxococcota bacterium]